MIGPPSLRRAAVLAVLVTATVKPVFASGSLPSATADFNDSTSQVIVGAPPIITIPPESQRVATGGQVTLRVTATGDGTLAYQWYAGPTGDTAKPVAGATFSTFTTPALTA